MSGAVMSFGADHRTFPNRDALREEFSVVLSVIKARYHLSAKQLGRLLGRTPRAIEEILEGNNAPAADAMLAACMHFDEAYEWMLEKIGRSKSETEAVVDEFIARLQTRKRLND